MLSVKSSKHKIKMSINNQENFGFDSEPTEPIVGQTNPRVAEILAGNVATLASDAREAVRHDAGRLKEYEGRRVMARAMVLYIDSTTGAIKGIGSHESLERTNRRLTPYAQQYVEPSAIEAEATGLPVEMLADPTTTRINAWYEVPLGTQIEPGKSVIEKPASWARDERIRLSQNSFKSHPLEVAIPDPIERGVFLKSIDDYNQMPPADPAATS
jgi:hypothetical protein